MYNEQKLKQIQNLVKTATVLSEQEKTEWMALIELMNDKQINELEEILKQPAPIEITPPDIPGPPDMPAQPTIPTPPVPTPPVATPPVVPTIPAELINTSSLSHISNLPSQFSDQPAPGVTPPEIEAPPQPAPVPMPPLTPPVPLPERPEPVPMPRPDLPSGSTHMPPVDGRGTISAYVPQLKLESFDDIAKLTAGALHQQNRETFHKTITDLAAQYGYFQVLTNLEESPLYKDYIGYGRSVLSGKKENLPLSQEEFEFITDVLLSLKVNRI